MKFFERLKIGFLLFNASVKSVLYVDSNKELAEDNSYLNYDDSTKILGGPISSGFGGIIGEVASSTNPTILGNRDDDDTGQGSAGADQYSAIAGGKEGHRITEITAGNDSLYHTLNGSLGQATGDEVVYNFTYDINKATSGNSTGMQLNVTETDNPGIHYPFNVENGGTSKFAIDSFGNINTTKDAARDLNINCGQDKTVVLQKPVFEDLVLPLDFTFLPAVNAPNRETLVGNLTGLAYSVGEYQEFTAELLHGYKETSPFEFHIHGALNATVGGSDETVKFEIEYSIANMNGATGLGDVFPATTTINAEFTVPATTPDLTSIYIVIGADETESFSIGATIKGRLRRIASSGTELAGDIFITQVGIHYRVDTIGSRLITAK